MSMASLTLTWLGFDQKQIFTKFHAYQRIKEQRLRFLKGTAIFYSFAILSSMSE